MKSSDSLRLGLWAMALIVFGSIGLCYQVFSGKNNLMFEAIAQNAPRSDTLSSADWWLAKVKTQASQNQGQQYQNCLFGDSISSGLKDSLGTDTVNFAMGGLSSVSLATQLKYLNAAGVQCQQAVVAIGTNDAWYITSNDTFTTKLEQCLALVRAMGAKRILLVPAFYSTVAASYDPTLAGPLKRVDEINTLIRSVATTEGIELVTQGLEPLFRDHALKEELTYDGVHLNGDGNKIYRQVLWQVLGHESPP